VNLRRSVGHGRSLRLTRECRPFSRLWLGIKPALYLIIVASVFVLLCPVLSGDQSPAFAQDTTPERGPGIAAPPPAPPPPSSVPARTPKAVPASELAKTLGYDASDIPWKQIIQLAFAIFIGLVALLLQFALLWRVTTLTADDILKSSAVTLIITFAVSSLIFGFNDQQIAPIVGLFGTIIGFLLGRADRRAQPDHPEPGGPPPPPPGGPAPPTEQGPPGAPPPPTEQGPPAEDHRPQEGDPPVGHAPRQPADRPPPLV
jgi:hypothetical protein